ncbi:MAG: PAS domain S-box protein, partial [Gammaproteobacteria bacterium]|nr:PAS domain S-box protein [Gammaproteobacteria bacterium]
KTNETLEDKIKLRTQELTASEEKYRIVADNTHDWEYWCDPEDIFIYSSPSCKDITGYDRSDFFENSQLLDSLIHPEDLQKFEDHRNEDHKNEEESSFTVKKLEFRIIDRSGEERWLSHICKPIFNQDTYLGYRASNRDITLSKRVQLELLQSEELLQVVFDSAPAIMFLINENNEVIKMNQSGLMVAGKNIDIRACLRPGDILNCSGSIQNPEGAGFGEECKNCKMQHIIGETFATNNNFFKIEAELNLKAKTKFSKHTVLISTAIVIKESPKIILVTLDDITMIKKIGTQLQQAQKMEAIGNLAGGIAHDFNNILFPIVGISEMLLQDLPPDSLEQQSIQRIFKAGKRASELVSQILAFSRQAEQKIIPVRIQSILKEVLKLCKSTIPSNIEISEDIQHDCGLIKADPTQIHQVAMNLITNAYHAVEEKSGKIVVQLKEFELGENDWLGKSFEPGRYAQLTISDTGCGIDPVIKDKIFDPYFTTKEEGKGTGLGLATVYGIISEYHG